jgi:hypothetical protein
MSIIGLNSGSSYWSRDSRPHEPTLSLPIRQEFFQDVLMRLRVAFILLSFLVCSVSFARVPKNSSRLLGSQYSDPAYGSALAAANRFLHAWQTQDHETGIMMLTDSARQHASREQLQDFFSSGPEAAFEIQRGKRLNAAEYSFPVVLFNPSSSPRPHVCRIVIIKAGKDDWAVDNLP